MGQPIYAFESIDTVTSSVLTELSFDVATVMVR